jgi:hypothetical protein
MALNIFPALLLFVAAGAPAGGDGTQARPFSTIQAAVQVAKPGTMIYVSRGTYGPVKLPSRAGGRPDAPIRLISADGRGAAKIVAGKAKAGIQGFGVHHWAILGFVVVGGENGIQLGLSGNPKTQGPSVWSDPVNYPHDVTIRGNIIRGQTTGDGVKVSQASSIQVTDNTISNTGDQCVDFVAVNASAILRNDCSRAKRAAAIFAKGGSSDIEIAYNHVHDLRGVSVAGISMGGKTEAVFFRPGQTDFEARRLNVHDNLVERVEGYALSILGAQDSVATNNFLDGSPTTATALIGVTKGSSDPRPLWPKNLNLTGNQLTGNRREFQVTTSRDAARRLNVDLARDAIKISNTAKLNDAWSGQVGPDALYGPESLLMAPKQ